MADLWVRAAQLDGAAGEGDGGVSVGDGSAVGVLAGLAGAAAELGV